MPFPIQVLGLLGPDFWARFLSPIRVGRRKTVSWVITPSNSSCPARRTRPARYAPGRSNSNACYYSTPAAKLSQAQAAHSLGPSLQRSHGRPAAQHERPPSTSLGHGATAGDLPLVSRPLASDAAGLAHSARCDPCYSSSATLARPKPFDEDCVPQLPPFKGDSTATPEAFLVQHRLHARQSRVGTATPSADVPSQSPVTRMQQQPEPERPSSR
jgi:hypothetical protein